jgi:6-pyruvoyltetrahydropterin/6-carboxytetrahydropterin synthase
MKVDLRKSFTFDAAHQLPNVKEGHKCGRVHGHTFCVEVFVSGEVDEKQGWLFDHALISRAVEPLIKELDHSFLNEIKGLEIPTIERLAKWFWKRLKPAFPGLSRIVVGETAQAGCIYEGK